MCYALFRGRNKATNTRIDTTMQKNNTDQNANMQGDITTITYIIYMLLGCPKSLEINIIKHSFLFTNINIFCTVVHLYESVGCDNSDI